MDKKQLRAHCRQLRDALPAEQVAAASAQICAHIAAWPLFGQAEVVMTYMAFRNEIDLSRLQADFPHKRWVIPRVVGEPEPRLVVHPFDATRLVRHKFGMLEPDAALPIVSPDEIDMVLTPGLAFDRRGFRLGLGGGFYDRFLPLVRAPKVGIVCQALIIETVPVDEHDQPVEYLACEDGIIAVRAPAA